MQVNFMRNFPWGRETCFRQKILDKVKIHTMRETQHLRPGHNIQMIDGGRFCKDKEQFNEEKCTLEQMCEVEISEYGSFTIKIDGRVLEKEEHWQLAKNDGFESAFQFYRWLLIQNKPYITLYIKHWTDYLRY